MITTYLQLLEQTLAKFSTAKKLNTDGHHCLYRPIPGSVGCAIGCHLDPAKALKIDRLHGHKGIAYLLTNGASMAREILGEVFDYEHIDVTEMNILQMAHDQAADVDSFRSWLQREIKIQSARQ